MVNPPYTTIPITTSATSKNRLLIFVFLTNTLNIIIAIPIMKVPTKGFKMAFFQWICGDIFFLINTAFKINISSGKIISPISNP